jgi:hypothetical protein
MKHRWRVLAYVVGTRFVVRVEKYAPGDRDVMNAVRFALFLMGHASILMIVLSQNPRVIDIEQM